MKVRPRPTCPPATLEHSIGDGNEGPVLKNAVVAGVREERGSEFDG